MPQNIYMLNLGFGIQGPTSPALNGSFVPYNSGNPAMQTSCAWLNYNGGPPFPSWATDSCQQLSDSTIGSTWAMKQQDNTYLPANAGDYLLVRVYTGDPSQTYKLRFGVIFGQGSDTAVAGNVVQSPLQMPPYMVARAAIDFPDIGPQNYTPSTTGSWVYLLGQLHGVLADYSLNVGATIFDPASNRVFALGHDPTMRVGGSVEAAQTMVA